MNTKQLRQKILDMAIKGQLVPQNPDDEPADKLLEKIREEKEQLIKDGKIKRDKNASQIFVGDDKLHYEKFSDGSVVCIEEDLPFEIPDNWAWERLKNICTKIVDGAHNPPQGEIVETQYLMASSTNINEDKIVELKKVRYLSKENFDIENARTKLTNGDILLTTVGTLGRSCVYNNNYNLCFQRSVSVISTLINNYYLKYFFDSNSFQQKMAEEATGTAQKGFYLNQLSEVLIPIAPESEQLKISTTIQNILSLVDKIESDKVDLKELIKQTKAKVLDLAIKGKLVSQDESDEPAEKLLEKIREEKEQLIKEGKLKRDKNETYIYKNSDDNSYYEKIGVESVCIDDDLPFEIPDNWKWCRFGTICQIARGGSPRPIEKYITDAKDGINWIKIGDTEKGGKYIYSTKEKIIPEGISKSRYVKSGDFLLTNSMSFGRPYILKTDGCIHDGWLVINDDHNVFNQDFLYYLLSSNVMYQLLIIAAKGSTVKNLKSDTVKGVIIPIPPFQEQQRIVEKIESIFAQLDNILNNLQ